MGRRDENTLDSRLRGNDEEPGDFCNLSVNVTPAQAWGGYPGITEKPHSPILFRLTLLPHSSTLASVVRRMWEKAVISSKQLTPNRRTSQALCFASALTIASQPFRPETPDIRSVMYSKPNKARSSRKVERYSPGIGSYSRDRGYCIPDCGLYIRDCGCYSGDRGFYIPDCGCYIRDCGYYISDYGYYSRDCGLYSRDCGFYSRNRGPVISPVGCYRKAGESFSGYCGTFTGNAQVMVNQSVTVDLGKAGSGLLVRLSGAGACQQSRLARYGCIGRHSAYKLRQIFT